MVVPGGVGCRARVASSGRTSAATFMHNECELSLGTALWACVVMFEADTSAVDDNLLDGIGVSVDGSVEVDLYAYASY